LPLLRKANNKVIELALAHKQEEATVPIDKRGHSSNLAKVQEAFNAQVTNSNRKTWIATYQKSEVTYEHTKWFQIITGMIAIILGILAALYSLHVILLSESKNWFGYHGPDSRR
jgi:hypothetical protein